MVLIYLKKPFIRVFFLKRVLKFWILLGTFIQLGLLIKLDGNIIVAGRGFTRISGSINAKKNLF